MKVHNLHFIIKSIIIFVFVIFSVILWFYIPMQAGYKILIFILLIFIFIPLYVFFNDYGLALFDDILSESYKDKNGFYYVKWRDKEFDEFMGEDLISLKYDSKKLYSEYSKEEIFLNDYSFIIFPLAKAFEGVLKKILVRSHIITEKQLLQDPNIPINSYFNPKGDGKIYNYLQDRVRDKAVPAEIYSVYQDCRNRIFHYDSYRDNRVTDLKEVKFQLDRIENAIFKAYDTFKVPVYRLGKLVNLDGTVFFVGKGVLLNIPDLTVFESWGYSFKQVMPANDAEKSLPIGGSIPHKISSYDDPLEQIRMMKMKL